MYPELQEREIKKDGRNEKKQRAKMRKHFLKARHMLCFSISLILSPFRVSLRKYDNAKEEKSSNCVLWLFLTHLTVTTTDALLGGIYQCNICMYLSHKLGKKYKITRTRIYECKNLKKTICIIYAVKILQ